MTDSQSELLEICTFLVLAGTLIASAIIVMRILWRSLRHSMNPSEPNCGECGYPVRGNRGVSCPECGSELFLVGINLPYTRKAPALILAWLAAVALLVIAPAIPEHQIVNARWTLIPLKKISSHSIIIHLKSNEWRWTEGQPIHFQKATITLRPNTDTSLGGSTDSPQIKIAFSKANMLLNAETGQPLTASEIEQWVKLYDGSMPEDALATLARDVFDFLQTRQNKPTYRELMTVPATSSFHASGSFGGNSITVGEYPVYFTAILCSILAAIGTSLIARRFDVPRMTAEQAGAMNPTKTQADL